MQGSMEKIITLFIETLFKPCIASSMIDTCPAKKGRANSHKLLRKAQLK